MERKRRGRRLAFLEEAGLWLREYGGAILAAAVLCALFAGLLHRIAVRDRPSSGAPTEWQDAEILRFGLRETKWTRRPVVIVRMDDGAVRQFPATPRSLRHCRKGSRIRLVREGEALFLNPQGCPAAADPG